MQDFDLVLLAHELNELAYQIDTYNYRDNFDTKEEGYASILHDLETGDFEHLREFCVNAMKQEDKELKEQAYDLDKRLVEAEVRYHENKSTMQTFKEDDSEEKKREKIREREKKEQDEKEDKNKKERDHQKHKIRSFWER